MRNVQSMQIGEAQGMDRFQPKTRSAKPQKQPTTSGQVSSQGRSWIEPAVMTRHSEPAAKQPRSFYEAVKANWNIGAQAAKEKAQQWRKSRNVAESSASSASDGTTLQDRVSNVKNDLKKVWSRLRNG